MMQSPLPCMFYSSLQAPPATSCIRHPVQPIRIEAVDVDLLTPRVQMMSDAHMRIGDATALKRLTTASIRLAFLCVGLLCPVGNVQDTSFHLKPCCHGVCRLPHHRYKCELSSDNKVWPLMKWSLFMPLGREGIV